MTPDPMFDWLLIGGLLAALVGLSGTLAALADDRLPWLAVPIALAGLGAAAWAAWHWPGGIGPADFPEAAVRLFAEIVR